MTLFGLQNTKGNSTLQGRVQGEPGGRVGHSSSRNGIFEEILPSKVMCDSQNCVVLE